MSEKVFMKGNEAIGEAAIRSGCMAYYGYPITPQNELTEYMGKNMQEKGRVFIQTESEITAINAVFGSSVAGFRAMTSSASTAMSLKQEGISHLAYLEIPAVIVDMMRGGPGLGNILATQGDYNQATKGGGTGDYHVIVLLPILYRRRQILPGLPLSYLISIGIRPWCLRTAQLGRWWNWWNFQNQSIQMRYQNGILL